MNAEAAWPRASSLGQPALNPFSGVSTPNTLIESSGFNGAGKNGA